MDYFISAKSFPEPNFGEQHSVKSVPAETPLIALKRFVKEYKQSAGLYSASLYKTEEDYIKGKRPLARYRSNASQKEVEVTDGMHSYQMHLFVSVPDGKTAVLNIDKSTYIIKNPKKGKCFLVRY